MGKGKISNKFRIESTVIVAIIAFVGTFLGYVFDSYNKRQQQQREFESTLIIKAVETGNSDLSKNNLQFLIDVNLISDKAQQIKLKSIIKDSSYRISRGASISWDENDFVYICQDSNSSKYHLSKNCRAISHCTSEILKVSVGDAESKFNRKLCGFED